MENREEITTIYKSADPDKLVVYWAQSSEKEIRFYLNDTQYIVAMKHSDGHISLDIREREKEEQGKGNKKSTLTIIKENFKEILKLLALFSPIIIIAMIVIFAFAVFFRSMRIYFFAYFVIMSIVELIVSIGTVMYSEFKSTSKALKSKHSAEHMMVNFLEKNKRLPQSMQEIKKSSRFSVSCGSRKKIKGATTDWVSKIIASIIALVISSCVVFFFNNIIAEIIIFLTTYYLIKFLANIVFKKNEKLDKLLEPIKDVFTNIVQYSNTTKKVKDEDLFLAYCAAREWIKVVYPEFYNQEEDVFLDNYFKLITAEM